jgi:hypothetical protein
MIDSEIELPLLWARSNIHDLLIFHIGGATAASTSVIVKWTYYFVNEPREPVISS